MGVGQESDQERISCGIDGTDEWCEIGRNGEIENSSEDVADKYKFLRFLLGAEKSYVMKLIREYLNENSEI